MEAIDLDLTFAGKAPKAAKPRQRAPRAFAKLAVVPWTICADTREQLPYTFQSIPDAIVTTVRCKLDSGDYSIQGFENRISWERKSATDLWSSLTWGRERFEREIAWLARYQNAFVGIEATWPEILDPAAAGNGTHPNTIRATIRAWEMDYPIVKWYACGDRRRAELACFRTLERWWRKNNKTPH